MTIEPKRYVVKPTNGILEPGTETVISVTMQPLRNKEAVMAFIATKQKFMVQWRSLANKPDPTELRVNLVSGHDDHVPSVFDRLICFVRIAQGRR